MDASSNEVREDGLTAAEEAELFDQIDTNQNGTINLDKLWDALVKLNFPFISIAAVFENFDRNRNGNGTIDRDEWRAGIEAGLLSVALYAGPKITMALGSVWTKKSQSERRLERCLAPGRNN